jgi:acetylornithine aminotransferase/acetylornithine/N-succinyldiaminopimelate aminotransferase
MNDTGVVSEGVVALAERERAALMQTFRRLPLELVSGAGCEVVDAEGRRYLDFVAGLAVNVLGHAHPAVAEAIATQARTLVHTSNLYYTRAQVELAERLQGLGFTGRAFLCNSGAEANETAIKVARKWGKLHRGGAFEILTAEGSFHGRTLATIAATAQPKYQAPFAPMPDGFVHVPFNDLDALRAATTERTVAVMLEPVQGESGVVPADPEYLRAVRAWCDARDLLLILDEVQTAIGRTGAFFAFSGYGVIPDVVTVGKGLGGGVPIAACLASARADVLEPGDHGSTFGGNPLACAAALATLDALEREGVIANAAAVGAYLGEQLAGLAAAFPAVAGERGRGLMRALVLAEDLAPRLQAAALEQGLIVNAIGTRVIRFVPPLIVTREQVDRAVSILAACLDLLHTGAPAPEAAR